MPVLGVQAAVRRILTAGITAGLGIDIDRAAASRSVHRVALRARNRPDGRAGRGVRTRRAGSAADGHHRKGERHPARWPGKVADRSRSRPATWTRRRSRRPRSRRADRAPGRRGHSSRRWVDHGTGGRALREAVRVRGPTAGISATPAGRRHRWRPGAARIQADAQTHSVVAPTRGATTALWARSAAEDQLCPNLRCFRWETCSDIARTGPGAS